MAEYPATVTPQWLHNKLSGATSGLVVFDCSVSNTGSPLEETYKKEHIPGSQFLNINKGVIWSQSIPCAVPEPKDFQEYARSLGVNSTSHVVLYDNADMAGYSAARLWWTFRYFGHDKVSVLNGGLKRWIREGFPITSDVTASPAAGNFEVHIRKELLITFEQLQLGKLPADVQLLDARLRESWSGEWQQPDSLLREFGPTVGLPVDSMKMASGHIPGAKNLPYFSLFKEDLADTLKDKDAIQQLFHQAGIDLNQSLVCSCYVGLTACVLALAAAVCGKQDAAVYVGSWVEYGQRASEDQVEITK